MSKCHQNLNDSFLEENKLIFKKFKPIKKIDQGAFGNIYSSIRLSDKSVFAIKTQKKNINSKKLESEAYYLYILQGYGIPKFITFGKSKNYYILIEELLDKSLYNVFIQNKKKCNLFDVCLLAIQILERLEFIHSKDILYIDIKPQNFLFGLNDPNVIYIIDFGLCRKYRSSKTGKHILPKVTGFISGTLKYASSNVIKGKEPSRRDDIISLGYMLIYLYKRELPWLDTFNNLNHLDEKKYIELINLKETNGNGELFRNLPEELIEYIKYAINLKFEEEPNYSFLRSLFNKIIYKNNLNYRILSFSCNNIKRKTYSSKKNYSKKKNIYTRLIKNIEEEKLKNRVLSEILYNNMKNFNSLSPSDNINSTQSNQNISKNFVSNKNSNIYNKILEKEISKIDLYNKEKINNYMSYNENREKNKGKSAKNKKIVNSFCNDENKLKHIFKNKKTKNYLINKNEYNTNINFMISYKPNFNINNNFNNPLEINCLKENDSNIFEYMNNFYNNNIPPNKGGLEQLDLYEDINYISPLSKLLALKNNNNS